MGTGCTKYMCKIPPFGRINQSGVLALDYTTVLYVHIVHVGFLLHVFPSPCQQRAPIAQRSSETGCCCIRVKRYLSVAVMVIYRSKFDLSQTVAQTQSSWISKCCGVSTLKY